MQFLTSLSFNTIFAQLTLAQVGPHVLPITPAKGTLLDGPPQLGLGTWYMRGNTSEAIAHAIVQGYRHIDCAKIYGNQRDVGAGIALGIKRAGITRQDVWVTSKLWNSE
jgi:alcohol dehydrogenase (NADP+)